MVKKFSVPRGTTDILPEEIPLWRVIEKKARQILHNYNYKEIRTPLFEETGLFKRSLGQASDIVNKQLLELASDKKDTLSLRPEGTASIVRAYIENSLDRKEAISKFFYMGPMFRGERPQKGRKRQFHQIGVEAIGPIADHPYLDAEIIALNVELLKAFGLKDYQLKLNTLGSLVDKDKFSENLSNLLHPQRGNLCADCQERYGHPINILRILDCKNTTCRKIVGGLTITDDIRLSPKSLDRFKRVKQALDTLNIDYTLCADLVRGLDYYTHTVFEISSDLLGSQNALSAGGRYNHLVAELGGSQVPAIGFALGIERVLLATENKKANKEKAIKVYVVALDEISFKKSFKILHVLRNNKVSSDMNYKITPLSKVGSQYSFASKNEINFVILIGETEIENQVVRVKDMKNKLQEDISVRDDDYTILLNFINKGFGKYVTNTYMR